jgi:hypothetical protein
LRHAARPPTITGLVELGCRCGLERTPLASNPSHLPSTVAEICSGNGFSENTRVREAAIRVAVLIRFAARFNFGLFLVNLGKELPYIVKQEIGLL